MGLQAAVGEVGPALGGDLVGISGVGQGGDVQIGESMENVS